MPMDGDLVEPFKKFKGHDDVIAALEVEGVGVESITDSL